MSSFAYAHDFDRGLLRARRLRQTAAKPRKTAVAWTDIPIVRTANAAANRIKFPAYAWALLAAVAIAHLVFAWYSATRSPDAAKPMRREVAIEFVTPPKPVEPPKVEPLKPQPPKPQAQKPAKTVPPIQQPAPEATSEAVSSEPAVYVPPVAAAPPAPLREEPVTPAFGKAGYLNNPPPEYPAAAERNGWEGTVLLRVRVLANGKVESVEVAASSGRKVLDEEAKRTVQKWSFSPSKRGDTPVDGWATVPIEFKLEQ